MGIGKFDIMAPVITDLGYTHNIQLITKNVQ
jgi:hypothetical protein